MNHIYTYFRPKTDKEIDLTINEFFISLESVSIINLYRKWMYTDSEYKAALSYIKLKLKHLSNIENSQSHMLIKEIEKTGWYLREKSFIENVEARLNKLQNA